MARVVHTYEIDIALGLIYVPMPLNAKIINVECPHHKLRVHALVDPDAQTELRGFQILATGQLHEGDDVPLKHWGSPRNGDLVWHLFEVGYGDYR